MHRLTHFPLCPHSRATRLVLGELGVAVELKEEPPWAWREGFLALNPAGELPVLECAGGPILCGAYSISEYLAEAPPLAPPPPGAMRVIPGAADERAEVRRLVDWFHRKLDREVTRDLLAEKVYARLSEQARRPPDLEVLRASRANLRYHLSYIGFLADQRRWLGGEAPSYADLAAAAHLSVADYLDEVPWEASLPARIWYARIKSRPSFRPLLHDRIAGMPPPKHYVDLDF